MKLKKLFNPKFSEELDIGKEVEYITSFRVKSETNNIFEDFLSALKMGDDGVSHIEGDMKRISEKIISYYNDGSVYTLINTFKKSIEKFTSLLNENKNILTEYFAVMIKEAKLNYDITTYEKIANFLNGEDNFSNLIVRIFNSINNEVSKTIDNLGLQDVNISELEKFRDNINELINSNRYDTYRDTYSNFINLLEKSNFYKVLNYFSNYIKDNKWLKRKIDNELINLVKGKKIQINNNLTNFISKLSDDMVHLYKINLPDILNKTEYKKFDNLKELFTDLINYDKMHLYVDPNTWKYFNIEFVSQFTDFDDYIKNSGIKKNYKAFSLFYKYGMIYGYDQRLLGIDERDLPSRKAFIYVLNNKLPIYEKYIMDYVYDEEVNLFSLKPDKTDNLNNTKTFSIDKLIKYFGVENYGSCIRGRLENEKLRNKVENYTVDDGVNFIIVSDNQGKTIGRFISIDDEIFVNLHSHDKAYNDAFTYGGKDVISKYIDKKGKDINDFSLDYYNIRNYDETNYTYNPLSKYIDNLKSTIYKKMRDMDRVFSINDAVVVRKKK